jgi:hypothetical protein
LAKTTSHWPAYQPIIEFEGWCAVVDKAKRSMKVKFKTSPDTLYQLEFDIMYPTEGGELKRTTELNWPEFNYLIMVRQKQNQRDSAQLKNFVDVGSFLHSWWSQHPNETFRTALYQAGIVPDEEEGSEGEEGEAAA